VLPRWRACGFLCAFAGLHPHCLQCQCLGGWEHCQLGPLGHGRRITSDWGLFATGVWMCSSSPLWSAGKAMRMSWRSSVSNPTWGYLQAQHFHLQYTMYCFSLQILACRVCHHEHSKQVELDEPYKWSSGDWIVPILARYLLWGDMLTRYLIELEILVSVSMGYSLENRPCLLRALFWPLMEDPTVDK